MNLLFDFTVNKETATIHVTREFAADIDLVWDAWTKAEILDQWVAPKPWTARTKEMDFREGGRWLYAMVSPENVWHWSLMEFMEIKPKTDFTSKNSFSDENGNPANSGFSWSITSHHFTSGAGTTKVEMVKKMADLAQLEKFIAMGYKEGMSASLVNLDKLLAAIAQNS